MDKVKFNPFSEILEEDFNRQSKYVNDGVSLFISDFLTGDKSVTLGLNVKAQAVADMTVYVTPGRLYQVGKQGQLAANSNPPLAITAAHPNYDRIDRICARYAEVDDEPETRNVMVDTFSRQVMQKTVMTRIASTVEFMVVNGTAAPTPVAPTVPDGWVSLAKINVSHGSTSIMQTAISDERPTVSAYLKHMHTGGGDGARIQYKDINGAPDLAEHNTNKDAHQNGIKGNAATATKLQTARKINGISFDGTTDITITDDTKQPYYSGTIKIAGDASKFYPVAFNCPAGSDGRPFQINIRRHMNDDAQNRGYLDFEMTGIGSGWGGCPANIFTRYYGNAFIADAKPAEKSHLMHVWLKGQNSYKWGGTHQIVLPLQIGDSVTIQNDTLTSKTEVVLPKGLAENGVSIATVDKVQQLATADVKTVDWNTLTTPGLYSVGTSSGFTAERHQPVGSYVYGILQVLYTPNGYRYGMVQIYYPHAGTNDQNRIRYRTGYGGTWNDEWKTLPNLDDVSSVGKGIVASSLGETGWAKYANGLIEQWGYATVGAGSTATITLPVIFNSTIYNIQTTVNNTTVDSRGDKQDWLGASPASLNAIVIRNGFEHNISSSKIWWRVMGV